MKNVLILDIDSERDQQIIFGKPETFEQPTNREEAYDVIINDIRCMTQGLLALLKIAEQNEYETKDILLEECIKLLKEE